MSKELIYTANTAGAAVPIGNTVPLGSIIRRYGNCISANGSVINIREPGYYDIDISATFTAAAAGDVTLTLLQDGVPVPGATATSTITTATTQVENSAIMATVRVMCCGNSNLYGGAGDQNMKKIKCLVENICEEVEDAEKYAVEAMRMKAEDPDLSKVYAELARQELGHADTLHNQAVRIIKAHKATGAETPPSMQIIWDWEHSKIVDKTARIKLMLEMCKQ